MLYILIRIAPLRRFYWVHLRCQYCIENRNTALSYRHLLPDLASWLTLTGSNYWCLEQFCIVSKKFEPLKLDCIWHIRRPRWLSWMRVRLVIRRSRVRLTPGRQHSFMEIWSQNTFYGHSLLPLIQEGQLSVSGGRMCTILVHLLED